LRSARDDRITCEAISLFCLPALNNRDRHVPRDDKIVALAMTKGWLAMTRGWFAETGGKGEIAS
jgi:hypothetical protein